MALGFKEAIRSPQFWLFTGIPALAGSALVYGAGDLAAWTGFGRSFFEPGGTLGVIAEGFSVLPRQPSAFPAWGASTLYGWLYPLFGLEGLITVHRLFLAPLVFAVLWFEWLGESWSKAQLGHRLIAYACWVGLLPILGERPAALGILLLVVSLQILLRERQASETRAPTRRGTLLLTLIQGIWVNAHGSFILLPLLVGWQAAWSILDQQHLRITRQLWVRFAVLVGASLANPYGARIFPYVLELSGQSRIRGITEFQWTTPFLDPPAGPLFFVLFLGSLFWAFRRRARWREWASHPYWPLLFLGWSAIRNTVLPYVALPSLVSASFPVRNDSRIRSSSRTLGVLALGVWLAALSLQNPFRSMVYQSTRWDRLAPENVETPALLAAQIRTANLSGCSLLGEIEPSGFLRLATGLPIFLHTQHTEFSDETFAEFRRVLEEGTAWESYLERYRVCAVVLDKNRHPVLTRELRQSKRWREVAQERSLVLWLK